MTLKRNVVVIMCVLLLLTAIGSAMAQNAVKNSDVPSMIQKLYSSFDPRKDPLEIEMIKEWYEGDIHIEQLYFTGQIFDGVKTRVYAYRAAPKTGKNLPGVLYCHGGGQTAYLEWVRFWAQRGYVCVSFDYSGDTNKFNLPEYRREHFTKWGSAVEKMMADYGAKTVTERSLQGEYWHLTTMTAQRSLTLLENHPRVNRNKLAAYGVSAGGYMSWMLAGVDKRVKTIVPIYGAGSVFRDKLGLPIKDVTAEMVKTKYLESPGNPLFYAPLVTCPVLFMTGTNDGAFNQDQVIDTFDAVSSKITRLCYTPRGNHHMEPPETLTLPMWMDWQLKGKGGAWPQTPKVETGAVAGVPQIRVTPGDARNVKKVAIFYALNNPNAIMRFWRDAENPSKAENIFTAQAPFLNARDRIYFFANVVYRSGLTVSSRIECLSSTQFPEAKPTLTREALIDSMETSNNWTWGPAYPDPKRFDYYFKPWAGHNGEKGFTVNPFDCENPPFVKDGIVKFWFGTLKISDPQWKGGSDDKGLLLDYYAPLAPIELTVKLGEYSVSPALDSTQNGWVTLKMEQSSFKNNDGYSITSWNKAVAFTLTGTAPVDKLPVFRNLRWDR